MPVPYVLYHPVTGLIEQSGTALSEDAAALTAAGRGLALLTGAASSGAATYVDPATMRLRARPVIPVPAGKALALGQEWAVPGLPPGTAVSVDGVVQSVSDADGIRLAFTVGGSYAVALDPPFPWVPAAVKISVAP